jgi:hypothetical protein
VELQEETAVIMSNCVSDTQTAEGGRAASSRLKKNTKESENGCAVSYCCIYRASQIWKCSGSGRSANPSQGTANF